MIQETSTPETTQPTYSTRNFSVRLSSTPRGARLARLLATEQLRAWGLPLDPARQLVAELATNASTHGRVPGRDFGLLLCVIDNTLRIEVT
ncbi:ATP-binding protein, partial [Streptomyces sp. MBT62]|uniref:ATP-binding protein n=1 Tax=Streptomyces sp. MBT62 TaxID=2800410 RepID=UPI001A2DAF25|nr:ATP-binding protein [Streptomyces sp. MBT62]